MFANVLSYDFVAALDANKPEAFRAEMAQQKSAVCYLFLCFKISNSFSF
jgi:hypothetical protein